MIVLISGPQGSGKTTLSNMLATDLGRQGYYVFKKKFADVLYSMHNRIRIVLKDADPENVVGYDFDKKDGNLLQLLGTEWGRSINPDIWAQLSANSALKIQAQFIESRNHFGWVVVFDDCRFENEFDIIKSYFKNVLTIRLEANESVRKDRAEFWRTNTGHPSEVGLDRYAKEGKFDATFRSDEISDYDIMVRTAAMIEQKIKEERKRYGS